MPSNPSLFRKSKASDAATMDERKANDANMSRSLFFGAAPAAPKPYDLAADEAAKAAQVEASRAKEEHNFALDANAQSDEDADLARRRALVNGTAQACPECGQ